MAKATDEFLERMEEGENGPNNNNSCKSQEEKQAALLVPFLALQVVAKVFRQSMKGKQIKCCICISIRTSPLLSTLFCYPVTQINRSKKARQRSAAAACKSLHYFLGRTAKKKCSSKGYILECCLASANF